MADPNLEKAHRMMRGMVKEARRRSAKAARKNGKAKLPRQICTVCARLFDLAIIKTNTPVIGAICSDCKQTLAQGYIAIVCVNGGFAFIKPKTPGFEHLAGKIIPATVEEMEKLKAKMDEQSKQLPPKENVETN